MEYLQHSTEPVCGLADAQNGKDMWLVVIAVGSLLGHRKKATAVKRVQRTI